MDGYISAASVKRDYGFTDALIKRFLPEPILVDNPFYRSAAPMRMYAVSDVEAAMANPEFEAALEKASRRSASSTAAAERRRQAFIDYCNGISITIPVVTYSDLKNHALSAKQDWYDLHDSIMPRDAYSADEQTTKRWMVNYLRHECTDYDSILCDFKGKIGRDEGYEIYHARVNNAIEKAYPHLFDSSSLRDVCTLQINYPVLFALMQ